MAGESPRDEAPHSGPGSGHPPGGTFEDRHSTAPVALVPWVLDALDLSVVQAVADLGCGEGRFALPVARVITPNGGVVYAVDHPHENLAMLDRQAQEAGVQIKTINADITEQSALPEGQIDLVMLNFVLNLLRSPQIDRCLDHAAALLRLNGTLLATAYGRHHMADAYDWLTEALVRVGVAAPDAERATRRIRSNHRPRFTLDDGPSLLRRHFDRVALAQFHDVLEAQVTDVESLVAPRLLESVHRDRQLDGVPVDALRVALREAMEAHATNGVLRIRSDIGTLMATEPHRG